jgi:hypothetical protein
MLRRASEGFKKLNLMLTHIDFNGLPNFFFNEYHTFLSVHLTQFTLKNQGKIDMKLEFSINKYHMGIFFKKQGKIDIDPEFSINIT